MQQSQEAAMTQVEVQVARVERVTKTSTMTVAVAKAVIGDCLTLLDFMQLELPLLSHARVVVWAGGCVALELHRQIDTQ